MEWALLVVASLVVVLVVLMGAVYTIRQTASRRNALPPDASSPHAVITEYSIPPGIPPYASTTQPMGRDIPAMILSPPPPPPPPPLSDGFQVLATRKYPHAQATVRSASVQAPPIPPGEQEGFVQLGVIRRPGTPVTQPTINVTPPQPAREEEQDEIPPEWGRPITCPPDIIAHNQKICRLCQLDITQGYSRTGWARCHTTGRLIHGHCYSAQSESALWCGICEGDCNSGQPMEILGVTE
jgi:hypothetical protein